MYKFIQKNDALYLMGESEFLKRITASVKRQGFEKEKLEIVSVSENMVSFSTEIASATLEIKEVNGVLGVVVKGGLVKACHKGFPCDKTETCLDADGCFYIDIEEIDGFKAYSASEIPAWWCRHNFGKTLQEIPEKTQALLYKTDDKYGLFYAPCDDKYKSLFDGTENGVSIRLLSLKQGLCNFSGIAFLFSEDAKPFDLPKRIVDVGIKLLGKNILFKEQRKYPEILEYLGWCTWDAFPLCVTHEGMVQKAEEFKEKNIPVRWAMIDDMWSKVDQENAIKIMHDRSLSDFKADPKQFPKGLKAAVDDLKNKYGFTVGVWHPITGYWRGFDPNGEAAKKYAEHLIEVTGERLVLRPTEHDFFTYHNEFYKYLKDSGIDFVKVDNQSCLTWFYRHVETVGEMAKSIHVGLEKAVDLHFNGDIINCMGCSAENIWNRPKSVVNRCSGDFLPENKEWFIKHILQCTTTVFFYSPFFCGDFDMFWSDDAQGKRNAVLRAISGGPIYVSDKVGRSVAEILLPCVLSDGLILRCKESARATESSIVTDPCTSNKPYTVWNCTDEGFIMAAFNLNSEDNAVSGGLSPFELPNANANCYAAYNYFTKELKLVKGGEEISVSLPHQENFELYNFVPLEDGIAAIGLVDKYVSSATFEKQSASKFLVKNGGKFAFFSEKAPTVLVDGIKTQPTQENNYYVVEIGEISQAHTVEILL